MTHGAPRPAWRLRQTPDADDVRRLAGATGLGEVAAGLLLQRAGEGGFDAGDFLRDSLQDLPDPAGLPGLAAAVPLLVEAVRSGETIGVFGDYDVDGITACTIVGRFLRGCGLDPLLRVPNRSDGYGLTPAAVASMARQGVRLIVTVDNGIAATEAVEAANRAGIPVIVTDHHAPDPAGLPPAAAIVHPRLGDGAPGWREASGAGVALALVIELRRALAESGWFGDDRPRPHLGELIELAALGTIQDMVPLVGANRILVRDALTRLEKARVPGLAALLTIATPGGRGPWDEELLAFQVGPRINAAGRVGDARTALALLLADDPAECRRLAADLDGLNRYRRALEQAIADEVDQQWQADPQAAVRPLIFGAHPNWSTGVLGIVAGRLARRYHRPTVLMAIEGDVARGSARSIPEIDLLEALEDVRDLAVTLGGHRGAAGMTVPLDRLAEFRRGLEAGLTRLRGEAAWKPVLDIDACVPLAEVDEALVRDLDRLRPFGMGNPRPLFSSDGFELRSPSVFRGGHLGFRARTAQGWSSAIAFGVKDQLPLPSGPMRVAYRPRWDARQGGGRVELLVEDLAAAALSG